MGWLHGQAPWVASLPLHVKCDLLIQNPLRNHQSNADSSCPQLLLRCTGDAPVTTYSRTWCLHVSVTLLSRICWRPAFQPKFRNSDTPLSKHVNGRERFKQCLRGAPNMPAKRMGNPYILQENAKLACCKTIRKQYFCRKIQEPLRFILFWFLCRNFHVAN